jgi:hypothetical protein
MMLARPLHAAAAGIVAIGLGLAWNASAQMSGDTRKLDRKRGAVIAAPTMSVTSPLLPRRVDEAWVEELRRRRYWLLEITPID